jgi:hypothetical protein
MKSLLRRIFKPLLTPLERGDGDSGSDYVYKPSHRIILIVISFMFLFLASLSLFLAPSGEWDYMIPVVVFGGAGLFCLLVGSIGKDIAVARLWGSRNPRRR